MGRRFSGSGIEMEVQLNVILHHVLEYMGCPAGNPMVTPREKRFVRLVVIYGIGSIGVLGK
jgi:hypothetical protein